MTTTTNNIRSELIRIVYSSVPITLFTALVNSAILSVIQWNEVTHSHIIIWFTLINSFSLIRFALYKKFKTLDINQQVPVYWEHLLLFTSALSGILWGAVAIWLFPLDGIAHQVFTAFVLAGMCAGAVTTLSPIMSCVISFVIFTILPLIFRFILIETEISYAMAIMSILFTAMILLTAKRLNFTIKESLLIRNQKEQAEEKTRTSDERFRDLTNLLPEAIYETDATLKLTYANRCAFESFGFSETDLQNGLNFFTLFAPTEASRVQDNITKRMQGEDVGLVEYQAINKDGTSFPVILHASCITNDNEVTGLRGVIVDITDRKQSELALRRSQKMDALGQLTGGIAHDFNNILNITLGNLELLEKQIPNDEKIIKRIQNIHKSTQRATDLTSQLLSFSRHSAENVKTTDINQLITEMDSLISHSVTPQIEIKWHLAEDLWPIRIAPGDFEDSLLNLIINARDAMSGSGTLVIETKKSYLDKNYCITHPEVEPGEYVEIKISDTGEGLSTEQLEYIFEPFYTTKEQGKGTGLGLAMVFGFVQRSKGHIKVDSDQGKGTTFRLYLPRSNEATQNTTSSANTTEQTLPTGNQTILVVDDEEGLRDVAKESLHSLGYRVFTAENAPHALEQLEKLPEVDLLISDVIMPGGLNGYELAEHATDIYPSLKVLLASGYREKIVVTANQDRFNDNLLPKPYSMEELARKVQKTLDV